MAGAVATKPALLLPNSLSMYISSARCVKLLSKNKKKKKSVNGKCSAFALTFHRKLCRFCWRECKNIFALLFSGMKDAHLLFLKKMTEVYVEMNEKGNQ